MFPRVVAFVVGVSLAASTVSAVTTAPAAAAEPGRKPPVVQVEKSVSGKDRRVPVAPDNEVAKRSVTALRTPSWPSAGRAEVDLAAGASAKAGTLSVSASRPAKGASAAARGKVDIEVLDAEVAAAAGIHGVLLKVSSPDAVGPVSVGVDYDGFATAFGGDYAQRLHLVQLPGCVLTTPERPECRISTPAGSVNSAENRRVTAEVTLASGATPTGGPDGRASTAAPVVLAATATAGGGGGDYKATSLSPAGSWSAGGSGGAFGYSYPLRLPPGPAGGGPALGLGYSSGAVDGRTSATNNQASWIGDGWDLWPGYVERGYKGCADDLGGNNGQTKTGDLCYATDNATLMLDGTTTELVKGADGWRLREDDGSKIERLTGAVNGDDNGEYWKVTATNGTQYFLGLNRLPGWQSGNPESRSAWTVPVFGNNSGEPCYQTTFAASHCQQAYRWNLDYVVDPRGNVTSYAYEQETNTYARNMSTADGTAYVRGGWLKQISYGLRKEAVFAQPPAWVSFDVAERCVPTQSFACDPAQLTSATAGSWPDVPFDQICDTGQQCTNRFSPTFFSRKRLAKVTTRIWNGAAKDVDQWTLKHSFPATGDGLSAGLWLASIVHTGLGNGASITLPETVFDGLPMDNRVDGTDGYLPITRNRLNRVTNETGGTTFVTYAAPDCQAGVRMPARPESNTYRCFPQWWTPPNMTEPRLDWFHKYVVTGINEGDRLGDSPDILTRYEYLGDAAWHHDENDLAKPERRTWSQWRGYGKVRTTKGAPGSPQTVTEQLFLRGMDADPLPAGTRDVWVTDSTGAAIEDHNRLQGFTRETVSFSGGAVAGASVSDPWISPPTATDGAKQALLLGTAAGRARTLVDGGTWRHTEIKTTFNAQGIPTQVEDLGDTAVAGDEKCARTDYARNDDAWMITFPKSVQTTSALCAAAASSANILSEVRVSYDGAAWGVAPTRGDVTGSEHLDRWDAGGQVFVTVGRGTHDSYGRPLDSYDANNNKSTTSYTPATGVTTDITVTNPRGKNGVTTLDPAWGVPIATVDVSGARADQRYDALGRLVEVWKPGRPKASGAGGNLLYEYSVRNDGPSVITARSYEGGYVTTNTLYDGLTRVRQTQTEDAAARGGRVLTDTVYDSRGLAAYSNGAYWNSSPPGSTVYGVAGTDVPRQTITEFDGLERPTVSVFKSRDVEKWRTTTVYAGDRVSVTPPSGGTPTTAISNAQGQVTERRQYQGATPSGAFDTTRYAYTRAGALDTVTDAAGNLWRYGYDLRGRQVWSEDPDRGRSTSVYDNAGQLLTSTDARGRSLAYTYDNLGRRTGMFDGSTSGTKLAEWTFDTVREGLPSVATRFVNGHPYKSGVTKYDVANRPLTSYVSIPAAAEGTELGKTYTFKTTYSPTGKVSDVFSPAAGGLPAEYVVQSRNPQGALVQTFGISAAGTDMFVHRTTYSEYGEPLQLVYGAEASPRNLDATYFYDESTRRMTRQLVGRETATDYWVTDKNYTRDAAGNITRIADTPSGGTADVQCFGHDYLRRLIEAWTPASGDCAAAPAVAGLGGAARYWSSYRFDKVGNRTSEVKHSAAGDTTRTYTYPGAGQPVPHGVRSVGTVEPGGSRVDTYGYDQAGNTTGRTLAGVSQGLDYDVEGRTSRVTEADGRVSAFVYDAAGSRLVKREPGAVTLFLPGMELRLDTATRVVSGTRFYAHGDTVVATRQGASTLTWKIADHQQTATVAVAEATLAVSTRRQDPYGNTRGTTPATWPDTKTFVGGTTDTTTGLTRIGARDYDPTTGRFTTIDPIMDMADPQQWNAYTYANGSPITHSDPTGLWCDGCNSGLGWTHYNPPGDAPSATSKNGGTSSVVSTTGSRPNPAVVSRPSSAPSTRPAMPTDRNSYLRAISPGHGGSCAECTGILSLLAIFIVAAEELQTDIEECSAGKALSCVNVLATAANPSAGGIGRLAAAAPEGVSRVGGVSARSGPWADGVENVRPGGAVAQSSTTSCVSACGEMLSEGGRTQAELIAKLGTQRLRRASPNN